MLIGENVWVTVKYRLFDSEGSEVEDSERELTYLQGGYGAVFPRIEEALAGHGVGYVTSVYLQPEESFGDYEAERVVLLPRSSLPDELEVGMTFEALPGADAGDDDDDLYVVTNITDEAVVLDGNHPLAGMALRFDLQVTGVRTASHEEVERERENARLLADDEDEDGELDAADADPDGERSDDSDSARRRLH